MKLSLVLVPPLGAAVIGALGATWHVQIEGEEHLAAARRASGPVIFAVWHGRMLPFAFTHRARRIHVLASEHHDGELLGRTIRYLGFGRVRGSSTRGGTKALMALTEANRAGHDVGLTVDGPRGPRFEVKPGVVEVAKLTGAPIVPIAAGSRRHRTFASWDGFELPLPFTRVVVSYGAPVVVPGDADRDTLEAKRREVEVTLHRLTAACDRSSAARISDGMPILAPLSWVYRAGVATARAARTARPPAPGPPRVVAVGNLEVGGSGKTPLALWLVERVAAMGKGVAYVSRGFASAAEHGPLVTVVSGNDSAPPAGLAGLRLVARSAPGLVAAAGDEAAVVAERAPGVPLVLARDKRRAVEVAARFGAEVVVVDDAFQSFALARHVDVLLLDAERPLANGRVLPAGRLREAPSAIKRANVVVFNRAENEDAVEASTARVAPWLRDDAKVYGLRRRVVLVASTRGAIGLPAAALFVAAIAKPEEFVRSVEATGVLVEGLVAYRDHHRYADADARAIRARAPGGALVTTEKDWTKLRRFDWGDTGVWIARLEVELVGRNAVDAWLLG